MDTFGLIFLVAAIALTVAGVAGFLWLSKRSPRTALLTAFFLFLGRGFVDVGNSRLLYGLSGVLGLVTFVGGLVAVVALAREPVGRRRDEQNPPPLP